MSAATPLLYSKSKKKPLHRHEEGTYVFKYRQRH